MGKKIIHINEFYFDLNDVLMVGDKEDKWFGTSESSIPCRRVWLAGMALPFYTGKDDAKFMKLYLAQTGEIN